MLVERRHKLDPMVTCIFTRNITRILVYGSSQGKYFRNTQINNQRYM